MGKNWHGNVKKCQQEIICERISAGLKEIEDSGRFGRLGQDEGRIEEAVNHPFLRQRQCVFPIDLYLITANINFRGVKISPEAYTNRLE